MTPSPQWWDWRAGAWRCLGCDQLEPCRCAELAEIVAAAEVAGYATTARGG